MRFGVRHTENAITSKAANEHNYIQLSSLEKLAKIFSNAGTGWACVLLLNNYAHCNENNRRFSFATANIQLD